MTANPTPSISAWCLVGFLFTACASADHTHRIADDRVQLTRSEYQQMQTTLRLVPKLQGQLQVMRAQLDALRGRLTPVEQRVELAPFESGILSQLSSGAKQISFGDGVYVAGHGQKPKQRNITQHLASYRGSVVAFWATWCVPCIADKELAHLKTLQRALHRKNVELLSVTVDELTKSLTHEKAASWLYPYWQRRNGHLEMLPKAFIDKVGVNLPLFLVVSKDGRVCHYLNRKLDEDAISDLVTAAGAVCLGTP
jgi:thiol-disulfide isomerase/thioredoxin